MTSKIVKFDKIARSFKGTPPVHAIRDANLTIDNGDYLAIVGPSGSGKSTLLNLLGLLDSQTSGRYILDGVDTSELDEKQRAGMRAEQIGFVFQSFHLLPDRSALENVVLGDVYRPGGAEERKTRAVHALDQVGLEHRLGALPSTLSGGERQRVAIARALVGQPSLLLADEPTGNLDTATGNQILDLFDELHSSGITLAVITHDLDVADRAQRQILIRDGEVSEHHGF